MCKPPWVSNSSIVLALCQIRAVLTVPPPWRQQNQTFQIVFRASENSTVPSHTFS